jgi:nucleotide-binding universal stress UspA family protein
VPNRILVGIDGSLASRAAVIWALERARSIRTGIVLLIIVDDEWGAVGERTIAELRETAEDVAVRELEFARERAGSVEVTAAIAVGAPMLVLATEASAFESVVIGTHKVGTFHGHALGSRGLQLAAISPVPTMVVPVDVSHGRSGVAVGAGDAPGWTDALRFAMREAIRLEERLLLVRAVGPTTIDEQALLEIAWSLPEAADLFAGIAVRRSPGGPGETLAGVSRRAVLTVSGRPTAPGARGFRPLGRANGDLLMNAGGPVAIVPFMSGAERPAARASLIHASAPIRAE